MESAANSKQTAPQMSNTKSVQRAAWLVLRVGVFAACALGLIGGIYYLCLHGSEEAPDYTIFSGTAPRLGEWSSASLINYGICLLIATPICRVLSSFVFFIQMRDWLYTIITAIVLLTLTYQFL